MGWDLMFCSAAAGLGLWCDGPGAWMSTLTLCGGASFAAQIGLHLALLPATCLTMLVATLMCYRATPAVVKDCRFAERAVMKLLCVSALYILMMIFMNLGQRWATCFDDTPRGAIYGGIIGTVAFVIASHIFRAIRVVGYLPAAWRV